MTKKLSWRDYLYVGSMLFGLFFGAGNLIFPVHMGQEAGASIFLANLGFLITGIGLPFLGVIAIGISKSNGVFDLATRVNRRYAVAFTVLLYLTIGPFFALPRLATTSFEIGLAPFLPSDQHKLVLALFSALFFFIAWAFSRKPSKLLGYVGKFLNPLFLFLLAILILFAFITPLGSITSAPIAESYVANPFFKGFTEGYNTLDALASLAFGIIIVSTIRGMGVEKPNDIAKDTIKSGAISVVLMGIIYTLLSYMGTMSVGKFPLSENGGIALAQIANHYLGSLGSVLLAFIVILACLKTAIGLITACSETFSELFPKGSYAFYIAAASILPCLFANVGLTNIIQFSIPVLMFLYPLAMILMILVIISPLFGHRKEVYRTTTYVTLVAALLDALNNAPEFIKSNSGVTTILTTAENYLPLFTIGMGWVVPSVLGFIIGLVWINLKKDTDLK
ncbi:branched-chain amino acid transport system II carrier protein [Enterococcus ureilyticus]|uniref:Branched-chain amino acid transport system carrier protein n=2 Tax=Enterococcus TaxID=1350 RepID=A0A1E5H937_9ENTE|nr:MULTISPECIES: branched-chain amino acid transport system II carrier protein [Enterococcus]ALS36159.1 branched-chain amino acid transporter II carrier protein [Enterococcus rotai]MBM7687622.1 LIVCS family branched-chain amino acid:cation transporter [Enterococcus ureilyticus]MBO0447764.1 branched-chain amino acid transport system II carrier protein [Enterococcus ureilyticus]OEG21451.1 branched-chain amino acid transport system II carrier protein [Enterococcus ureilyticus]